MKLKWSTAAIAYFSLVLSAQAETVVLKSADGTIELSGELIEFQDDFYVLRTELGDLRVSTSTVFCEGTACPVASASSEVDLKIAGETALSSALIPLLVAGYADHLGAEPETDLQGEVTVQTITGDQGFGDQLATISTAALTSDNSLRALLEESADIAMISRRVSRDEARDFRQNGAGLIVSAENEFVAALDSLVVIVHPDNPIKSMSLSDLAKVYSGEIGNWNALGGPDLPIKPLGLQDDNASTSIFFDRIDLDSTRAAYQALESEQDLSILTSRKPGAIGYVGMAVQRQNPGLELLDSCGLRHIPSRFSTKTEEYALTRRIYAYTRSDIENEVKGDFLEYVRSQDADNLIAKAGFVDLGMERVDLASTASSHRSFVAQSSDSYVREATEDFIEKASDWDRLSITFRFATASSRLDQKAERDLERLLAYIETLEDDVSLAFVGFTDSDGPFNANLGLGESRANALFAEIGERLAATGQDISLSAMSFGELAPVACNSDAAGKAMNRRVEVWIQG